jgi:hypothetical protein
MGSKKQIPSEKPVLLKTYYKIINNENCDVLTKHVFKLIDKELPILIQYFGKNDILTHDPHKSTIGIDQVFMEETRKVFLKRNNDPKIFKVLSKERKPRPKFKCEVRVQPLQKKKNYAHF